MPFVALRRMQKQKENSSDQDKYSLRETGKISKYRPWLYVAVVLLLFPALYINLGLMTLIDDEGIRCLVALEMKLSGNYITPTLNGGYYYNKPPLFNWILLVYFQIAQVFNEFVARVPTTVAMIGYGLTIIYFFRKHVDLHTAIITALAFITCGRILWYDSMLALIDITFSWVTFTTFMVVYHQYQKGNLWKLFIYSYLLTAAGFMMKGFPSIVFQGITLLAFFIYRRQFKKLFSLQHIAGGVLFLAIVGIYYLTYNQYHPIQELLSTLFTESSKRTVANHGIGKAVLHFITFPFEMIYHFLPWTLLIIYFIRKDIIKIVRQHDFMSFLLLMFLSNIFIYWISPQVFPRYLFMFVPLIFGPFLFLHNLHAAEKSWQYKVLDRLFFVLCILTAIGSFTPFFLDRIQSTPYLYPITITLSVLLITLAVLYHKLPSERLTVLVMVLLVLRIGFNCFVLPDRHGEDFGTICKNTTVEVGQEFADKDLYVYKYTVMQPTNGFYLTNERQQIVTRQMINFEPDALYIIDPVRYPDVTYTKVGEFKVRHGKLTYDIGFLKLN